MQKNKQKKPNLSSVISAGRSAFLICIDPVNNPYRNEPQRSAWNKGFFDEMNVVEFVRPEHGAKEQARRKYAAPARRIPYGISLPDKPFRFERFLNGYEKGAETGRSSSRY